MKKFVLGLSVGIFVMGTTSVYAESIVKNVKAAFGQVNVTVNGKVIEENSVLIDGITYLPVRAIGEYLDLNVNWNDKTSTAELTDKTYIKPKEEPVKEIPKEEPKEEPVKEIPKEEPKEEPVKEIPPVEEKSEWPGLESDVDYLKEYLDALEKELSQYGFTTSVDDYVKISGDSNYSNYPDIPNYGKLIEGEYYVLISVRDKNTGVLITEYHLYFSEKLTLNYFKSYVNELAKRGMEVAVIYYDEGPMAEFYDDDSNLAGAITVVPGISVVTILDLEKMSKLEQFS